MLICLDALFFKLIILVNQISQISLIVVEHEYSSNGSYFVVINVTYDEMLQQLETLLPIGTYSSDLNVTLESFPETVTSLLNVSIFGNVTLNGELLGNQLINISI